MATMITFLHTYHPSPVLLDLGDLAIHWYGFLYGVALIVGLLLTRWIARRKQISLPWLLDLTTLLVLSGIVGARLWYVLFIEPLYFFTHPLESVALWNGGLALHGGLAGALLALFLWCKRKKVSFVLLTDLLAPALILGQAIGRWGNYFNQELYGRPTTLPWGIPIPLGEDGATVFVHPTFLYESLANIVLFFILLLVTLKPSTRPGTVTLLYLSLYSLVRFALEFLRVDPTPTFLLRLPQWVSLAIIVTLIVPLLRRRAPSSL